MFKKQKPKEQPEIVLTDIGAKKWRQQVIKVFTNLINSYSTQEINNMLTSEGTDITLTVVGDMRVVLDIEQE